MCRLWSIVLVLACSSPILAEEINAISWNLESGASTADPEVIADQIAAFSGVELFGFSEVDEDDAETYATACTVGESANFEYLLGTTGGGDRLLLVWNSDRFEVLEEAEFLQMRAQTGRAPLAVQLRERSTGHVFWFMVNHLHRGSATKRNEQATLLRQWIRDQDVPVVACGDYNFDYDIPSGEGNEAFNIFRQGNHVRWVEPGDKIRTQRSYNSILDFFFVNDDAASWQITSRIRILPGDFDPTDEKSDHRPVDATIVIPEPTDVRSIREAAVGPRHGAVSREGFVRSGRAAERGARGSESLVRLTPTSEESPVRSERTVLARSISRPQARGAESEEVVRRERDDQILEQLQMMRRQIDQLERAVRERR